MASVSNTELETFAKIIMRTKAYKSGKLDLTGLLSIYINHITSEAPFNVCSIHSLCNFKRMRSSALISDVLYVLAK